MDDKQTIDNTRGNERLRFWLIAAGAILGFVFAKGVNVLASPFPQFSPQDIVETYKFFGMIFLNALKMIIVPLIVCSMIAGVSKLGDVRRLGRIGSMTIFYYITTTFLAVLLGLILVSIIKPGVGLNIEGMIDQDYVAHASEKQGLTVWGVLANLINKLVTPNLFKAMLELNILPLIVFSLIIGVILTTLGKKGRLVLDFFDGMNEAILKFVDLLMWFAPIGVFGLVAWRFGDAELTGDFYKQLRSLAKYAGVVSGGLLIHGCVTLPVILFFLTRRNPFTHMRHVAEALLCAVSTASSSATLPVTLDTLDRNAKVSRRTSGFVATLGATINMDGTALYEAVAVVFIAQALNYDLTMAQLIVIFLTATLAAIGAAGIPEAGLVTMLMVLAAVGIPFEGVGLIFAIDWFLDRLRTTVNVWGDCVGCAIIDDNTDDPPSQENLQSEPA